jgi:hypothetical protein
MDTVSVGPNTVLDANPVAPPDQMAFIRLELRDKSGKLLSENFYWQKLGDLPAVSVTGTGSVRQSGNASFVHVDLTNAGDNVALMAKLTLRQAAGGPRILPAYASDNYISLMPGEHRTVEYETPVSAGQWEIGLSGWNIKPAVIQLARSAGR